MLLDEVDQPAEEAGQDIDRDGEQYDPELEEQKQDDDQDDEQ